MSWHFLGKAETLLQEGEVKAMHVDSTPIALYRIEGQYYATHNICTHQTALLSEGFIENGEIECPLHQGRFDIRSGKALCTPVTENIKTFLIKNDAEGVFIDIDKSASNAASIKETSGTQKMTAKEDSRIFVIIGAGQAAASAINSLHTQGFSGEIHLIGAEEYPPYERPPLSKDILLGKQAPDSCQLLSRQDLEAKNVVFHHGKIAHSIDSQAKKIIFGDKEILAYDKLLIATGASPRQLDITDIGAPYIYQLRSLEDAIALKKVLRKDLRLGIIGGGFIGLEVASTLCALRGKPVIIEAGGRILARILHPSISAKIHLRAEQAGTEILTHRQCKKITPNAQGVTLEFDKGENLEVDIILVGVGSDANYKIAEDAGIAVANGGIIVDKHSQTSAADIYAAGDVAIFPNSDKKIRLESWHNANQQADIAARHMAGDSKACYENQPWFWSDQFGINIQMIGLSSPNDEVIVKKLNAGEVTYLHDGKKFTAAVAINAPSAIGEARIWLAENLDTETLRNRVAKKSNDTKTDSVLSRKKPSKFIGELKMQLADYYVWPKEGLNSIPDWVYTDETIYECEVEKIFHGATWNYVALEAEIPNKGDFKKSFVGPTPVVVSHAQDGEIYVFENRCAHRAAEFCREHRGNAEEFVCPYHQWSYDLQGNLVGVPFRRGVDGKGGFSEDFKNSEHGLKQLKVTKRNGVIFASFKQDMVPLEEYFSSEILTEFDATFDGRKLVILGYYRNTLPGNWKLYHENLKDPYHATLLHSFLVSFGLLVAGNKSKMICDETGRHGVMASAKSEKKVDKENSKEMRAYVEGMTLKEMHFMNYIEEFNSPWSVTMQTVWPNMIIQREMNTLGVRHIIPQGPNEFIMIWTMFGFEGDTPEMTEHRLVQGNLMGPAGFLGLEDNEAMKFVQDGMRNSSGGNHYVGLDPKNATGSSDSLISESAIRAMYQHWRMELGL